MLLSLDDYSNIPGRSVDETVQCRAFGAQSRTLRADIPHTEDEFSAQLRPAATRGLQVSSRSDETRTPNRVQEIRTDLLMTRTELAVRAGLSLRTVWSVESGRVCRLCTRRKIITGLGLSRRDHRDVFPAG